MRALALFLCAAALGVPSPKLDANACTWKGRKLSGRIQWVTSFPDLRIRVVRAFPNLRVRLVKGEPRRCGEWKVVTSHPDLRVQVVGAFPDLDVAFVDRFPGLP
ncbi:hypothetical protein [Geothrix sp. 21YS21S-4]|uniref:hypothetical protein n=1 Tax=Geothrix sp. 21YS21S-4 TaxID=3068889 RepID=UPI0027BA510F|nr:hypothetical protein [Geothrix sp. 21YS21S-4]